METKPKWGVPSPPAASSTISLQLLMGVLRKLVGDEQRSVASKYFFFFFLTPLVCLPNIPVWHSPALASFRRAPIKGCTLRTRISGPSARTLELPLFVRSAVFFFFFSLGEADFRCLFRPFSRGGNFRLPSSSYGVMISSMELVKLTIVPTGNCVGPAIAAVKVPAIETLLGKEKKKRPLGT